VNGSRGSIPAREDHEARQTPDSACLDPALHSATTASPANRSRERVRLPVAAVADECNGDEALRPCRRSVRCPALLLCRTESPSPNASSRGAQLPATCGDSGAFIPSVSLQAAGRDLRHRRPADAALNDHKPSDSPRRGTNRVVGPRTLKPTQDSAGGLDHSPDGGPDPASVAPVASVMMKVEQIVEIADRAQRVPRGSGSAVRVVPGAGGSRVVEGVVARGQRR
jgi:hypothetical protein